MTTTDPLCVAATNVDVTAAIDRPRCRVPPEKVATHDPICVGVLAIARGGRGVGAVLSVDALGLPRPTFHALRNAVAAALGVPPTHVIQLATHNHSGPLLDGFNPQRLIAAVTGAAGRLARDARPAEMAATRFDLAVPIGFNRRVQLPRYGGFCIMFNDDCRWVGDRLEVSGQLLRWIREHGGDPEAERMGALAEGRFFADGPVDPSVDVLAFRELGGGRPLATFVRHACHPVIIAIRCGPVFSADYPDAVRRAVSEATGAATVFAVGCCGNVRTKYREHSFAEVERLGGRLGNAVVEHLAGLSYAPLSRVAFAAHEDAIPFGEHMRIGEAEVKAAVAEADALRKELAAAGPAWRAREADNEYNRREILGRIFQWPGAGQLGEPEWQRRELAWQSVAAAFNDAVLVGLPGEIFWQIGEQVRRGALERGARAAVVCEDARCDPNGYWPTEEEIGTGGYENHCCAGDRRAPAIITQSGIAAAAAALGMH